MGARLGRLNETHPPLDVEDTASTYVTDIRPDQKSFRCLIGFYTRAAKEADRKFTLLTGSTVPNAKYMNDWYRYANGKKNTGIGNMMPTGCYVYRVGVHTSPSAGPIKPALRLTDTYDLHVDGSATVIRTKNNEMYDVHDVWCKTVPYDNVHCSFQTTLVEGWGAPFSSAGCMTIRGKQTPSDQWAKAQAILNKITMDKRCDVTLLTARDLAIASALRKGGDAGHPEIVQRELGRLRPGSQGDEVAAAKKTGPRRNRLFRKCVQEGARGRTGAARRCNRKWMQPATCARRPKQEKNLSLQLGASDHGLFPVRIAMIANVRIHSPTRRDITGCKLGHRSCQRDFAALAR